MSRGPRIKTLPIVHWGSTCTKLAMQAISCEALPLYSNPKRGNEMSFFYVKRAKAKNSVISYLGVPRVRNDQCKQCQERLYP